MSRAAAPIALDEALVSAAARVAQAHGATANDLVLLAWAIVLARIVDGDKLELALSAGSEARLIRLTLDGNPSVGELLEQIVSAQAVAAPDATLVLEHTTRDGVTVAQLAFDASAHDPALVSRAGRHVATVLAGLVAPGAWAERRVDELPIFTSDEAHQLLVEWNATGEPFPDTRCLHELFEAHARATPRQPAVVGDQETLDYGELDARANRLANHLRARSATSGAVAIGPDSLIGIALEASIDFVVAVLAVLKTGAAYVPLDPHYPRERLAYMLDDTRVPLVITRRALPIDAQRQIQLDEARDAILRASDRKPEPGVDPAHLAYLIYTSGSTGRPKGIALAHLGVVNNLCDLNRRFAVGARDRILFVSSPSFDMSVYEVLGTLAAGATIVLPRGRDPEALAKRIADTGVTVWSSAPALLQALVDHVESSPGSRGALCGLRLALLGGDWVPVTLPTRLRALAPSVRVIVMGGATESSVHSTLFEVDHVDPAWRSIPYGRPMANQATYVLDARLRPVPVGVVGELYLAGVGLARGYHALPDRTAERFLPNPFVAGARMYRTGDLARYRSDGVLELLGRVDHQVKVRGVRVELGEIEAQLREHPRVRQAVVVQREDAPGERRLVAYLVASSDGSSDGNAAPLSADELRRHAGERLPAPMVPATFVLLDALPLSPNGKVDRRALPAPTLERTFTAPRTPTEQTLLTLAIAVLRRAAIGVDEDLFEVGFDSLHTIQLSARIRSELGVDVSLRMLLETRTIARLAEHVVARQAALAPATELSRLLDEVARLSPDDARRLARAGGKGDPT